MTKALVPALLLTALCAACANEEAVPQPDPAKVERLLAHLETQAANTAEPVAAGPALPEGVEERLTKADGMVESLEKVPAERLDPSVAEALIAR